MTIAIVAVFLIGYFFIATEGVVKVNKLGAVYGRQYGVSAHYAWR